METNLAEFTASSDGVFRIVKKRRKSVSPCILQEAQGLCLCRVMARFILVGTCWETPGFKAPLDIFLLVLAF